MTIDSIDTTWNGDPATGCRQLHLKVNNIAIPEATLALIDSRGMLKQLGYPGLNFDITTDGDLTSSGDNMGYSFNLSLAAATSARSASALPSTTCRSRPMRRC